MTARLIAGYLDAGNVTQLAVTGGDPGVDSGEFLLDTVTLSFSSIRAL